MTHGNPANNMCFYVKTTVQEYCCDKFNVKTKHSNAVEELKKIYFKGLFLLLLCMQMRFFCMRGFIKASLL